MNSREREETIQRYNRRLQEYGPTDQALGWGKKGRTKLRFRVLLSQWNLTQATIIDFGCGFGDLFGYMVRNKIQPSRYIGIDINNELIAIARQRYPQAEFVVTDDFLETWTDSAEYVISSGVFNFRLQDSKRFIERSFDRFASIATKGFAANFLSNKVEYSSDDNYHADPCEILSLAYKYSNNVVLRNDYMPYEFTIFVNTGSRINPELTVYEEFANLQD